LLTGDVLGRQFTNIQARNFRAVYGSLTLQCFSVVHDYCNIPDRKR
jgi:hypothetical protein